MASFIRGLISGPLVRQLVHRPRLGLAFLAGFAVFWLVARFTIINVSTSLLIGWNTAAISYLTASWVLMGKAQITALARRAEQLDEGETLILILSSLAAILSLIAIVFELATTREVRGWLKGLHVAMSLLTIISSWAFIHTAFAFHYAHVYYLYVLGKRGASIEAPLNFPGTEEPLYTDFLYFAFVIGTSGQTADVSFTATGLRRVGLVHCVVAFLFNTTVLALMINIAAGLIGN